MEFGFNVFLPAPIVLCQKGRAIIVRLSATLVVQVKCNRSGVCVQFSSVIFIVA